MKRSILQLVDRVLGDQFVGPSWAAWRALLRAIFALPLSGIELETFRALTGRTTAPSAPAREVWAVCGRRGGKSQIAALVAVFLTTCRAYKLAPGERGVFPVIAADRRQARVVRGYIGGLLHSTPVLEQMIARETAEAIELSNGITIEIHTASYRTIRGYTVVGAVLDEVAFWANDEDAADPDREILAALRPAMATIEDALLLCLSSPYAKRGEVYRAHRDHYGVDGDPVLVIQAETRALNPTVPADVIERAYLEDPSRAAAEYGARFRDDIESFLSRETVEACVIPGRTELPCIAEQRVRYVAFCDPSGGSGKDSFTLAIGHSERGRAVVDVVRESRPPFSPEAVVGEFAELLGRYRVRRITGDRYAGEWPREAFRRHGITYDIADRPKSDIYRDALPLLNSQRLELPDDQRLTLQIASLERRTARGGRDSIDHAPGKHDDVANAVCGLAVLLGVKQHVHAGAPVRRLAPGRPRAVMNQIRRERAAFAERLNQQAAPRLRVIA